MNHPGALTSLGVAVALFLAATAAAGPDGTDDCLTCHLRETPGVVRYWETSAHRDKRVSCAACHGNSYETNHEPGRTPVTAAVCGRCHEKPAAGHKAGKHGIGFRAGQACTRNETAQPVQGATCLRCHEEGSSLPRIQTECARFLAQSSEMRRRGCLVCHGIENRCDTCHTPHDTDPAIVRDPSVCAPCHMGPDHPQDEMWRTSKHGVLYYLKGNGYAPDCAACHMAGGSHDVSRGITMGLGGQPYPEDRRSAERTAMIKTCKRCHTRGFSRRSLDDADAIEKQARALVEEGREIVVALYEENLLQPAPDTRPPHPLSGAVLELGSHMLYENLSRAETLFFRMKKFYYVTTYKGVFHQNADYAHWYGIAPLKLALSELRSEAALLRAAGRLEDRVDTLSNALRDSSGASPDPGSILKRDLRLLREEFLSGRIPENEYRRRKEKLLKDFGL